MKTFVLVLALVLGGLTASAQVLHDFGLANNVRTQQLVTASTTVTNVVGTNTYTGAGITNPVAVCNQWNDYGATLAFTPMATPAGTLAVTLTFARSLDAVTWETTPKFTVVSPAITGTSEMVVWTNLTDRIGPAPYLKLVSALSAETDTALTNVSLKLGSRRLR